MRKLFTTSVFLIVCTIIFAQSPEKLSYQAVIRNSSDELITNQAIAMQISILQGSISGTPVYLETQEPATNQNGLVSIEIGTGTVVSGEFSSIDWASGPYFIKTDTDPDGNTGGINYTISGTSQLLSVPYALHAKTAETVTGGIIETDPVFNSSVASGITAVDTANWNAASVGSFNELDPVYTSSQAANITEDDITNLSNLSGVNTGDQDISGIDINTQAIQDTASQIRADIPDVGGFITSETDPVYTSSQAANITADDITNLSNLSGVNTGDQDISGIAINTQAIQDTAAQIRADIPDVSGFITSETDPLYTSWDKDYNDLINKPVIPTVPTNVSEFTNDAGYLTSEIDGSVTNELQVLSISNDTIYLSSGGFVKLPYSGLTNFTESNYIYDAKTGVKFTPNNAESDVNFVIQPKGTGAILAQQPDGTAAGGNSRGAYAVDQQIRRSDATQVASGDYSTIIGGRSNTASGVYSTAMGSLTTASGLYSTAMGLQTTASGPYSTSIGYLTTASGAISTAIGYGSNASGNFTIAMGNSSDATSNNSIAIGKDAAASNEYAVAIGNNPIASGYASLAMGDYTTASGRISTAFGNRTTAPSGYETVLGRYNSDYTPSSTTDWIATDRLFVVGNGATDVTKSNALTILKNANTTIGGSLTINGNGTDVSLTFPTSRGTSGQVLQTDGSGNTSWLSLTSSQWSNSGSNIYYNTGNVGIGTTAPNSKLTFDNSIGNGFDEWSDYKILLYTDATPQQSYGIGIKGNTLAFNSDRDYDFDQDGSTVMTIQAGKVGIGTESPLALLDLGNTISNRKIMLYSAANNDHQFTGLGLNTDALRFQLATTSGNFKFYGATSATTSTELFRIEGDGDVVAQGQIKNVSDPTDAQDAATMAYVERLVNEKLAELKGELYGVTDIDGNFYPGVKIGTQIWMAEDLRVTHYPNGDPIPLYTNTTSWTNLGDNNTDDGYCFYNNDNSTDYGALYTYAAAIGDDWARDNNTGQGVCPDGWHLPTDAEWTVLTDYLGGTSIAGGKMKETGTTHWNSPNTGATNESGFSALPSGYRSAFDGSFINIGNYGYWWSATEIFSTYAYYRYLMYDFAMVNRDPSTRSMGFSVRCVKNQ